MEVDEEDTLVNLEGSVNKVFFVKKKNTVKREFTLAYSFHYAKISSALKFYIIPAHHISWKQKKKRRCSIINNMDIVKFFRFERLWTKSVH